MLSGLLGRKVGMTQVFTASGVAIPVTVIEAGPCVVTQVRTMVKDGYEAAQIGFGEKSEKHETRPMLGHLGHELKPTERQRAQQQKQSANARQEARRKASEKAEDANAETAADEAEAAGEQGKGNRGSRASSWRRDGDGAFPAPARGQGHRWRSARGWRRHQGGHVQRRRAG